MKYQLPSEVIPQSRRKEINEKILYLINHQITSGITQEDMYQAYTGDGSLHGLNFEDFENFHQYTESKKQYENGQFFTPATLSQFVVECLQPSPHDQICDLTCGAGAFFNFLPNEENVYGNELDIKAFKVAKYLYPKAHIENRDIRMYEPNRTFDTIIGNPPFNLKWKVGKNEYWSQWYFILKSYELLKPAGILAMIVPKSFLSDDFRDGKLIEGANELFSFIGQISLPINSFKQFGVEQFETKLMLFQKKSDLTQAKPYHQGFITMKGISFEESKRIYHTYLQPLVTEKEQLKSKLLLEAMKKRESDRTFEDKVKKYLFDIKRHPRLFAKYGKAQEYVHTFYTQEKPDDMKWDEWEKKRITKNKVLSYLKRIVKSQHHQERDEIRLVKHRYGLKYKAYSRKTKIQLSKMKVLPFYSFTDLVLENSYPFEDKTYQKLVNRKRREYERQTQPFATMCKDNEVEGFLDGFSLHNHTTGETITPNVIQREDIGKALQKRYSFIQWECGCGKSVAGLSFMKFHLTKGNVRNIILVAPAIAIKEWEGFLSDYQLPYRVVDSIQAIECIQKGEIVLVTLNRVVKYQRQLKQFVKRENRKVGLVFDEAHSISNIVSQRTKGVLAISRGLPFKMLLSATMTKNSISEAFPSLYCLFGSSVNFINHCDTIFVENPRTKELEEKVNDFYRCPYPAYQKGQKLFQRSHIPTKATVFGIERTNQSVYHSTVLKDIIDRTILTRTFEEVAGRKIYEIKQETCQFNPAEKDLYNLIIKEFYKLSHMFRSTGNSRKDSMLKIIRQINLLIKSTSTPHLFKEWKGLGVSSKFEKVGELVERLEGEQVAIGCLFIETVKSYQAYLKKRFPHRPIIVITGESTTLTQRKRIVKELKNKPNAILLSTQSSLSSSLNINYLDHVIVPEINWNLASMKQYFFRYIRMNSERDKKVYFVSYQNSIEANLLNLLINKEKLNYFMKDVEINEDELHEELGINFDLLEMLMSREKDEEGHLQILWKEQVIC